MKDIKVQNQNKINRFTANTVPENTNDKESNDISSLIKAPKKTYTPVRVEDEILEGMKNYTRDNNLKSHGVLINHICRKFLVDSGYIKE